MFNQRDCNVGREPPQEKRETKADRKLAKSVETKAICRLECETPPRTRKLTFDEALPKIGGGIG